VKPLPLAALLLVISAPLVSAEESESPSQRIDALCHSWTASRCIARVGAYLWSATSGALLKGQKLRFVTGSTLICTSFTDASGKASCTGVASSGRELVESGVRVLFEGDGRFTAESAVMKAVFRAGSSDLAGVR
jgi:hypothetical protein